MLYREVRGFPFYDSRHSVFKKCHRRKYHADVLSPVIFFAAFHGFGVFYGIHQPSPHLLHTRDLLFCSCYYMHYLLIFTFSLPTCPLLFFFPFPFYFRSHFGPFNLIRSSLANLVVFCKQPRRDGDLEEITLTTL